MAILCHSAPAAANVEKGERERERNEGVLIIFPFLYWGQSVSLNVWTKTRTAFNSKSRTRNYKPGSHPAI